MYITQGLHRHLQCQPDATAIRYQGRSTTYGQLGERVARLAGALKSLGVNRDERVAMLSLNSQRYLEYYQAVPWADAVLNPVNIRWSAAEIVYSLDDSQSCALIVDDHFLELAGHIINAAKTLQMVIYAGDRETPPGMLNYETLIEGHQPVEDARRGGDALLGIFYTGGTTGFPKGVMLSHTNVCSAAMAVVASDSCRADERYLHIFPMFHLADLCAIASLFITGGTHVVLPSFEPQAVLETIAGERISETGMAPTMIQMLLDWLDSTSQARKLDLSSLRVLGYGASPITPALLERVCLAFPAAGLRQGYGMTELAPLATVLLPHQHRQIGKMFSAGQAALCTEVRIVDADDREVPRGTVGEIVARGANVMLGYWNNPQTTAQALRGGWMHTGDGGYMDEDGFIYVCDRLKDMIVSGGENIYCAEVETAIASHPCVAQAAVIGIPCDKWGETVHAVIILKAGALTTEAEIVAHCRTRIAGYKCPRSAEFRAVLPLSSVGKVLKTELREPFWKGRNRSVA